MSTWLNCSQTVRVRRHGGAMAATAILAASAEVELLSDLTRAAIAMEGRLNAARHRYYTNRWVKIETPVWWVADYAFTDDLDAREEMI